MKDWTFQGFAGQFDDHVRGQLPWYSLASAAVALIARHYIPKGGLVYDLGASTGNIGRRLADVLDQRGADLIALDECPDMIKTYKAPGQPVTADITTYKYRSFDVATAFLTFMFLSVQERRKLLDRLKQRLKPGGAIIIMDKEEPPGGYPSAVLARLTWAGKAAQGVSAADIAAKELSLAGIQRPLYRGELGPEAVEVFRFGDFARWIIEGRFKLSSPRGQARGGML